MKGKNRLFIGLVAAMSALVVVIVVCWLVVYGREKPQIVAAPSKPIATPNVTPLVHEVERIVEVEKLVTVEKEITSDILREGLADMGWLVTEKYYFTEVADFSKTIKLFGTNLDLPFSETSYLVSYDGTVFAGVDFAKVRVEKNDAAKTVTVTLPKAEIQSTDIDTESFVLYSEKNAITNPLSVRDFNQSLTELENTAQRRAVERGLLENAAENAKHIVEGFVGELVDMTVYHIVFKTA